MCQQHRHRVKARAMLAMYLILGAGLAGRRSHGGQGGCLIRHRHLQLLRGPGQRGQGSGLGQGLELRAGQTACSSNMP